MCEFAQACKKGLMEYLKCNITGKSCIYTRYCIHDRCVKNTDEYIKCAHRNKKLEEGK